MVIRTGIGNPVSIPQVQGLPAGSNASQVVEAIRSILTSLNNRMAAQEATNRTLAELLRQSNASAGDNIVEVTEALGSVTNFQVRVLNDGIAFLLSQVPYIVTQDTPVPTRAIVRLYRGLEDDNATTIALIAETTATGLALEDHPPAGVRYRYWLQYRSQDGTRTGPLTPAEGILYSAAESTNPEVVIAPDEGGLFLETFENADITADFTQPLGGVPTIDYPENGIVGGKVARIAGAEYWGVSKDLLPYDPSVLYRLKIGLKRTVDATVGGQVVYAGVVGVAADGVTLINGVGANSYSTSHYIAAVNATPALNVYTEYVGYFKAFLPIITPAPYIDKPSGLHSGIKYIRPMFIVNYQGNSTYEVDYLRLDALEPTPPWLTRGNCTAHDTSWLKDGGTSEWDTSDVSSLNSYDTCFVRAKASNTTTNVMFGLKTNQLSGPIYTALPFAWYLSAGTLQIYENGSLVSGFGTYTTGDEFAVIKNGTVLTYLKNRVVIRTTTATAVRHFAGSSFYSPGAALNSLAFGPGTVLPSIDTAQIALSAATETYEASAADQTIAMAPGALRSGMLDSWVALTLLAENDYEVRGTVYVEFLSSASTGGAYQLIVGGIRLWPAAYSGGGGDTPAHATSEPLADVQKSMSISRTFHGNDGALAPYLGQVLRFGIGWTFSSAGAGSLNVTFRNQQCQVTVVKR